MIFALVSHTVKIKPIAVISVLALVNHFFSPKRMVLKIEGKLNLYPNSKLNIGKIINECTVD